MEMEEPKQTVERKTLRQTFHRYHKVRDESNKAVSTAYLIGKMLFDKKLKELESEVFVVTDRETREVTIKDGSGKFLYSVVV